MVLKGRLQNTTSDGKDERKLIFATARQHHALISSKIMVSNYEGQDPLEGSI